MNEVRHHERQQLQHDQVSSKRLNTLDDTKFDHLFHTFNKKKRVSSNVSGTKFDLIKFVIGKLGYDIKSADNFDCNLIWDDTRVSLEAISELKSFQKYNHFPAMTEISRKDALARNISKLAKLLPNEYTFTPHTWILPHDYMYLKGYASEAKRAGQAKTFILKPSNAACGHGIKLFKNVDRIKPAENFIVQEYMSRPYLLNGYKFDLRIYVLVTSCDPLKAFIYSEGLVRLGTEKYHEPSESNIDHLYMHLTNYSLNKHNVDNFDTGSTGTKRTLSSFFEHIRKQDGDSARLWCEIKEVVLKTLLVAEPYLFHSYRMCRPGQAVSAPSVCFELLGFDILIDENLKPWLLEVNRSPSFGSNQKIDFDVKTKLLIDTFNLVRIRASDRKKSEDAEKVETQRRLYHNSKSNKLSNGVSLTQQQSSQLVDREFKQMSKQELIEQLKMLKIEKQKIDYENCHLGDYERLFPVDNKTQMDNYLNIISVAFNIFYPIGKNCTWKRTYDKISQEEILDKIAEIDNDEQEHTHEYSHYSTTNSVYKYLIDEDEDDEEDYDGDENNENKSHSSSSASLSHEDDRSKKSDPIKTNSRQQQQQQQQQTTLKRKSILMNYMNEKNIQQNSLKKQQSIVSTNRSLTSLDRLDMDDAIKNNEEKLAVSVLKTLKQLEIKFPCKSSQQTKIILNDIYSQMDAYKTRLADYWMIKLNDEKRFKILEIVHSNLRATLQKVFKTKLMIDDLRLYKIFAKLLKRMLWSHGQGLLNCFSNESDSSWTIIFNKNSFPLNELEMKCCERVVELCKDCVIIVYKYAIEQKKL